MEGKGPTVRIRYDGIVEEGGSDKSPVLQEPSGSGMVGFECREELTQLSDQRKFGF